MIMLGSALTWRCCKLFIVHAGSYRCKGELHRGVIYVYMYVLACVYVCARTHARVCVYLSSTLSNLFVYMYVSVHLHLRILLHTHTHTHTHTHRTIHIERVVYYGIFSLSSKPGEAASFIICQHHQLNT